MVATGSRSPSTSTAFCIAPPKIQLPLVIHALPVPCVAASSLLKVSMRVTVHRARSVRRPGQALVELALLLLFIAVMILATLTITGQSVREVFDNVGCALSSGSCRQRPAGVAAVVVAVAQRSILRPRPCRRRRACVPRATRTVCPHPST